MYMLKKNIYTLKTLLVRNPKIDLKYTINASLIINKRVTTWWQLEITTASQIIFGSLVLKQLGV